jgi:hypothetical protein
MKISLAYYLIFLISSLSISCGNDHPEVDRVTVKYIYSGTETFRRISRNEFNGEVGKGGFMSKELQSKRQINQFMNGLEDSKSSPSIVAIDVRAKAFIHYKNGKVSVACFDRFGNFMVDDKPKGLSHSLLSFLHATCDGF